MFKLLTKILDESKGVFMSEYEYNDENNDDENNDKYEYNDENNDENNDEKECGCDNCNNNEDICRFAFGRWLCRDCLSDMMDGFNN
jgi:hypothetical protein